jgi:protease-4
MKRLLVIFAVLLGLGFILTVAGFTLAHRAGAPLPLGKRVLAWRLSGELPDLRLEAELPFVDHRHEPSVAGVWRALSSARGDASVVGVALAIDDVSFGLAKAQELRRELAALRAAGKFVRCYLETAGEGTNGTLEYYLASACDSIALAPTGEVNLLGLYADSLFLRGSFDKLKIEPSFLHIGAFKSYSETFTERGHSPAAREALDAVLDSYYGQIVGDIAAARDLEPDEVTAAIDAAPLSAQEALDRGLVDSLVYPDEFRAAVEHDAPAGAAWLDLEDYDAGSGFHLDGRRIAMVFAQGTILRGEGGLEPWTGEVSLGARDLGRELRDLADDDDVLAVVLRIDSPGGSALASDLILREVTRLADKKPVIVSMSDVAASGGYYIAARATRIVAEEGTLTGSIGVVSGKIATGKFQQELLGATHDALQRGANAGIYSPLAPFDDAERAKLEARMLDIYNTFVGQVATGRKLTREAVEAVAQGRVWTGKDAQRRGLVDDLGGLDRALEAAREAAHVGKGERIPVAFYPEPPSFWDWLTAKRKSGIAGADLARALALLAAPRAPQSLELPLEFQRLARPF